MIDHLDIIGSKEKIDLPDLGIEGLVVKVDTGARRSALHADNIKYITEDGHKYVVFDVVIGHPGDFTMIPSKAKLYAKRRVVSSNGNVTKRPVIATTIRIGDHVWSDRISLIDRSTMTCRMLLGRMSIKNKFIVDVSRNFLIK